MATHCISGKIAFQPHFRRRVEAGFDGGTLSTDGGAVLLRDQAMIEHSLEALVRQRVFALALGHEDVNDHDQLRHDRLLALACGRKDLDGATRRRARDRGVPLAGKSTLNRLEDCSASAADHHRHHRIAADIAARKAASSTAATTSTAICPCTSSAGSVCCARSCAPPTATPATGWWRSWSGSSRSCALPGRRPGSWCAGTAASAARVKSQKCWIFVRGSAPFSGP